MERAAKRARRQQSPLSTEDAAVCVQAAFRGFAVRCDGLAARRKAALAAEAAASSEREEAALAARARSPAYRQIARLCKQADAAALARADADLERLVGHASVKEYCGAVRRDCLARAALGEPPLVRNVLISGSLGVGKKRAASCLAALLRALGVARGVVCTRTTLESLPLDVRRDVSCVVVEGLGGVEAARGKVDAVLANFPAHCFIFVGPTDRVEALHGAVSHFRKVEPAWLQLPNFSPAELAEITAAQLRARGYALADGLGLADLQSALCATWPRDVLAMRNAHLAAELVQRALSHRNARLPLPRLLAAPPALTAADLGLQAHGLASMLAARAAVDAEVRALVGMDGLKAFLGRLRAKVELVERGADPRLLQGCLNVVLTGNPGAGKTTAARLLFRALRALGLLKRDVFVERNALELKGTHVGWTCPQVKEMVQAALGGCLFLDEAYALSGGGLAGEARGDSFSDEALRTLLTETESHRTSLCVVLAGYRDAMDGLMRADPGLVRRFPTSIHLDDYAPAELAAIAAQTAASRFGLRLADGLEPRLAAHIGAEHAHEIHEHNASLAVSLVEAAINRLAVRLSGRRGALGAEVGVLVASDFCIGGDGAKPAERQDASPASVTTMDCDQS
jgi:transcriptional regulator with AAA-type ATPase domain